MVVLTCPECSGVRSQSLDEVQTSRGRSRRKLIIEQLAARTGPATAGRRSSSNDDFRSQPLTVNDGPRASEASFGERILESRYSA